MTQLSANTARLKCDFTSVNDLVDANTSRSPIAWRSLGLNVQFAMYDGDDIVDSFANIDSVTLLVKDKDTPDALAYISETIDAAELTACTAEQWVAGTGQHGVIAIDAADLGLPAATYWFGITALLLDGTTVKLGKGVLDLRTSGVSGSGGSAFLTTAQGDLRYVPQTPTAALGIPHRWHATYGWLVQDLATGNWHTWSVNAGGFALGPAVEV